MLRWEYTFAVLGVFCLSGAVFVQGSAGGESSVAILQDIQSSSEPGRSPSEKQVAVHFVFRGSPARYTYDLRPKKKKLVFRFLGARTGSHPIRSVDQRPLTDFHIEQDSVDVNRQVPGLEPQWHNVVTVVFDLKHVPVVTVTDQYSVITFSYTWTTDPSRIDDYVLRGRSNRTLLLSLAGLGGVGGGVLAAYLLKQQTDEAQPREVLRTEDLPQRELVMP